MSNAPVPIEPAFDPMYNRGHTVFSTQDRDSNGRPTRKKLWVWESEYVKSRTWGSDDGVFERWAR
ncbi:hypothetical protein HO133_001883 [Letharia lupina]|uniref:Uncharacterized protein n=1 Tax=Letharia lupina TaxID=560253 RepID=A0A8H6FB55_9LECA|nr:uncharacterized protein HO133_001883 [Letharia lupina]KAF6221915.1 hypothetical protein HO133_001883 [Letharia lupina]